MSLTSWLSEPYQMLLQGHYDQVANFYEALLEQEPEVSEHYWYLGLAYLLLGQEEQAQLTWFVVLGHYEGKKLNRQIQSLTQVLEEEAERQEAQKQYSLAWLIRGHIRELSPDNINNLIQFICLDIIISPSPIEQLQSWNLPCLLPSIPVDHLSYKILIRALSLIPCLPSIDALFFTQYALHYNEKKAELIATILEAIKPLMNNKEDSNYVVNSLKICLEFDYYNLSIINAIFVLYNKHKDTVSSTYFARIFLERSQNLTEKLFGYYQLLYGLLSNSDWLEGLSLADFYIQCLESFVGQEPDFKYLFIKNSLVVVNQPLLYLQDNPQHSRPLINYISQVFQKTFRAHTLVKILPFGNLLSSDKVLKIGYIGHTLKGHPVGYLSRWLIHYQNPNHVKNYGYLFGKEKDEIAEEWFAKKMEKYYLIDNDIEAIVRQIQTDQIDILVDLDGCTLDLTCQVMALKPAPIQVTWLGFDASGIPNIDYFIADPHVLPADADSYYREKIWRLPHCYLGIDGFEMGVPTLRREDLGISTDAVIFINFQNAAKRHPQIIHQQMKILKAVTNSYLLIKGTGLAEKTQKLFESIAQKEGIDLDRLRFLAPCRTEMEHRANLMLGDVVLDTYPYNGATTTLEILWAGIPLVTRVGEQFAARNSYTFMINAGINEGIAWTDEEYIEWGIKLGTDANLRQQIRWKMYQSRQTSPLWNGKQFAYEMEKAYRQMWEIYVRKNQE